MTKCVCGVAIHLDVSGVFVLDCKHILCQPCSQWALAIPCTACRIQHSLSQSPVDATDLINHIGLMQRKYIDALTKKQNCLRAEASLFLSLEAMTSQRDDLLAKHTACSPDKSACTSERKRKMDAVNMDANVAGADPRKRSKVKVEKAKLHECRTGPQKVEIDLKKRSNHELEMDLAQAIAIVDEVRAKHHTDLLELRGCCQQLIDQREAEYKEAEGVRIALEIKQQALADMETSLNERTHQLSNANNTICTLEAHLADNKRTIQRLEAKAIAFEDFARRTKTYYKQEIEKLTLHEKVKIESGVSAKPLLLQSNRETTLRITHSLTPRTPTNLTSVSTETLFSDFSPNLKEVETKRELSSPHSGLCLKAKS